MEPAGNERNITVLTRLLEALDGALAAGDLDALATHVATLEDTLTHLPLSDSERVSALTHLRQTEQKILELRAGFQVEAALLAQARLRLQERG